MTNPQKGVYLAIITSFISGVTIFVNKFAVGAITPPLVFTAVKNTGVGLLIIGILLAGKKRNQIKKLTKREVLYLGAIGVIGGAIPFYLYFTGLSMIPAVNAALIHKTLVFWVALFAVPFLGERLSKLEIMAVLMLFASNFFVGGFKGFEFSRGEILALAATVFWAFENVLAKKILPTVDPDIVTASRMGIGSLILLAASFVIAPEGLAKVTTMTVTQWFWLTVSIATLLGYVTSWYRALKLAPAITVSAVLVSSTLVTNILSAIFVTRAWNDVAAIPAILILLGVGIIWFSAKSRARKVTYSQIPV